MKSNGSLAEHDFPSLVRELYEERRTGVLTLTHAGVGRSVTLQEGRLVFASSSSPDDRMGPLLLRRGRITLRQLTDAASVVAPGKRLGAVLVDQGVLAPKDLIAAVVEHTQEIIYGAFAWTEGQYRLQEGVPSSEPITLKISTPDIIMEGIRRIDSWSRIDRAVGGPDACYERSPAYADVVRGMRAAPEKMALLRALDQPTRVETLCGAAGFPDFEVCRALWAFRVIGLIRRTDEAEPATDVEDESLGIVVPEE
jgi:Domain of unknown function (DUF4388)